MKRTLLISLVVLASLTAQELTKQQRRTNLSNTKAQAVVRIENDEKLIAHIDGMIAMLDVLIAAEAEAAKAEQDTTTVEEE